MVPSLRAGAALLLLLVFAGVSSAQGERPQAPDGRPALVGRGSAHDLGRVLVRPKTAEERQLVEDLLGLEAALELRLSLAARRLRARRCMGLVRDSATGTLTEQVARFDTLSSRSATELAVGDDPFAQGCRDPVWDVLGIAAKDVADQQLHGARWG